jgi:hypothetical protein
VATRAGRLSDRQPPALDRESSAARTETATGANAALIRYRSAPMDRRAVLAPFAFAALVAAQDAPTDWQKEVEKACNSPRYGLRLAASKKIAQAGDAAVPAVRAFSKDKSKDALPVALVEAFADLGGNSEPVLALLEEWSKDREFFWRAQALKGLWLRSEAPAMYRRFKPLFDSLQKDPAWLVAVYADLPIVENWGGSFYNAAPRGGDDPRAKTKFAAMVRQWDDYSAPYLIEALGDERTFLGDPWGRRRAQEAFTALRARLGDGCGYLLDAKYADNEAAIARLIDLAAAKFPKHDKLGPPAHLTDPAIPFAGGLVILSCRNGDLFVRWTADGQVHVGLEDEKTVALPAAAWKRLSDGAAALQIPAQSGVVICDNLRLVLGHDGGDGKVAPGSLPPAVADWLKQLGAAIEEAGDRALATALHDRLQQFTAR